MNFLTQQAIQSQNGALDVIVREMRLFFRKQKGI